ncbi:MAG: potassium channel protein [Candidatus Kapabacteria bacterium]|nr:potassium channel protein [Candidatus Kapabacteria bacterium]
MIIKSADEKKKPVLKKPIVPGILLAITIITGIIGYYLLWYNIDSGLVDAIYMTFTTISTIGFGEIHPLNSYGRIFTMIIGIGGIGSLFYILTETMENLVILQLFNYRGKQKMIKKLNNLTNHIILIGHGRVGKLTARELFNNNEQFVIIERSFKDALIDLDNPNVYAIEGNAADDSVLIQAGIKNARCMIVATGNSSTTVFVVLSAKVLNPDIFIVARADDDSLFEKLKHAGADEVISPYTTGGQRLALAATHSEIHDFMESGFKAGKKRFNMQKFTVSMESNMHEKTLKELDIRHNSGVTIIAVVRDDKPYFNPNADYQLLNGDELITIGTTKHITTFEEFYKLPKTDDFS